MGVIVADVAQTIYDNFIIDTRFMCAKGCTILIGAMKGFFFFVLFFEENITNLRGGKELNLPRYLVGRW